MTKVNLQLEPGVDGKLIYYPGHLLKGVVELSLDHPKKFRGLHVTTFGSAKAHWTQTERTHYYSIFGNYNRNARHVRRHFEGIEIYLNSRTYLLGQSGGPTFEMPPGIHRYEFTCQLPPHLPYTVGLKHAEIGYYVDVVLDIPWQFDKESKVPLIIIPYVDLNFYQHLRIPQNFEMCKNTCSLFCETGRLQMTIHVPYTGFAIGQKVPVKFSYINRSNCDVLRTKMTLTRITSYNAQTPHPKTKTKEEDMFVAITDGVKNGETISFDSIFEIPKVMLCTNDNFCRVVTITYVMKIEAVFGGLRSNLKIVFPVVIGTMPIREEDPFPQNPVPSPALNPFQYSVPMFQPSAPDFPPSFEEATTVPMKQDSTLMQKSMLGNFGSLVDPF